MAGCAPPFAEGEELHEEEEPEEEEQADHWQAEGGDPRSPWKGDEENG